MTRPDGIARPHVRFQLSTIDKGELWIALQSGPSLQPCRFASSLTLPLLRGFFPRNAPTGNMK